MTVKASKGDIAMSKVICDQCGKEYAKLDDLEDNFSRLVIGNRLELGNRDYYHFCSDVCLFEFLTVKFKKRICKFCGEMDCESQSHKGW